MAERQASAEIEPTPEMVRAGVKVLMEDRFFCGSEGLAELTVRDLLRRALSCGYEDG